VMKAHAGTHGRLWVADARHYGLSGRRDTSRPRLTSALSRKLRGHPRTTRDGQIGRNARKTGPMRSAGPIRVLPLLPLQVFPNCFLRTGVSSVESALL
jgi:hypothetical protein